MRVNHVCESVESYTMVLRGRPKWRRHRSRGRARTQSLRWSGRRPRPSRSPRQSPTRLPPRAAPVRPAKTIAVISGPSSRSSANPTPFTTKITAPKSFATSPDSKAMITPMRKPTSNTTGTPIGTSLSGDAQHVAPVDAAASRECLPQLNPTLPGKLGHLRRIGDLLHRGAIGASRRKAPSGELPGTAPDELFLPATVCGKGRAKENAADG
jgi:hypothetical protein